jgi:hypothetical protein
MRRLVLWQRRTYHECASELRTISEDFRSAHTNRFGWDSSRRNQILRETSTRGVEILRTLALAVRNDQDFGMTATDPTPVGAVKSSVTNAEASALILRYRPPYNSLDGFGALTLREALNKIAHADPAGSGFFAENDTHDLILTGRQYGRPWAAVISLIDLCDVIESLPDASVRGG